MVQIILNLLGTIIVLSGVILVYDARVITKKMFNFGNQNDATSGFKILGVILCIVGAFIIYL